MSTQARTCGVHHVGLTVPDLQATRRFFTDTLGFALAGGRPEYPAAFVSDGHVLITLWQAEPGAAAFDRRRCAGLHHLALAVPDHGALEALHELLGGTADVAIEFAPEPLGDSGARHMMCTIPGGVRLELISTTP